MSEKVLNYLYLIGKIMTVKSDLQTNLEVYIKNSGKIAFLDELAEWLVSEEFELKHKPEMFVYIIDSSYVDGVKAWIEVEAVGDFGYTITPDSKGTVKSIKLTKDLSLKGFDKVEYRKKVEGNLINLLTEIKQEIRTLANF